LIKKSERGDEALKKILESGEDISVTAINFNEILYGLRKYAKPVREVLRLPRARLYKEGRQLICQNRVRNRKHRSANTENRRHDSRHNH